MSLGEKLSQLRKQNNYTQEQLADILGVSRQSVSKWESDVAYPETDKLIRLSTLLHCSLDYLVREDIVEPQQVSTTSISVEGSQKAGRLFCNVIRFAPLALYSLWALLLWALYDAPLIKESSNNLYQWFGSGIVYELQPTIEALISLGVIAGVYIVPLAFLQRFASKKANFIANLCCFAMYIGVFVCVMCLIGVCPESGLESGKIVLLVAILTGVTMLLHAGVVTLDFYFNGVFKEYNADKAQRKQAIRQWFRLHKVVAIVVACVLIVGVALSAVLPTTVGNKFSAARVSRVKVWHAANEAIEVLGKPMDVDKDRLCRLIGLKPNCEAASGAMYYLSPKAGRLVKSILRTEDEIDNLRLQEFLNNDSFSASDLLLLLNKYAKLKKALNEMQFKYIEVLITSVEYQSGVVENVEYDSCYSVGKYNEAKWNVEGKRKQNVSFDPDEIKFGNTPDNVVLWAKNFYSDGSYKLSRVEYDFVNGSAKTGWTITWHDHWGKYTHTIKQSTDASWAVDSGDIGDDIYFLVTKGVDAYSSKVGYHLEIYGNGQIPDSEEYPWSKYANDVNVVHISDGISNVPDNAFINFTRLTTVNLHGCFLDSIGSNAFYGCVELRALSLTMDYLKEIRPYAFACCAKLQIKTGSLPKEWTLSLPDGTSEQITVNYDKFIDGVTDTYCQYLWTKSE
ncbi:MAG: helix-turn-helix domain-containing protein [Clostridiales bacterium]|nr:helix-turn-helix domain-containing protein [Clostridiales bacterium]